MNFQHPKILTIILLSLLAGIVLHQVARFICKDKAKLQLASVIAVVAVAIGTEPSWIGASAALMGYFASHAFINRKDKPELRVSLSFVGLGMLVMLIGIPAKTITLTQSATAAMSASTDAGWVELSKRSEAAHFAYKRYKTCISDVSGPSLRFRAPPEVCEAAAVLNARTVKGEEFAKQVSSAIGDAKRMPLNAEADKDWKEIVEWMERT